MNEHRPNIQSAYLRSALDPKLLAEFMKKTVPWLAQFNFDAIAFRGVSGALVAPLLAYTMDKPLIVVRKPQAVESRHAQLEVEGDCNAQRYLIVDDFCSTGKTVAAILEGVYEFAAQARCIGGLFYDTPINCRRLPIITQRMCIAESNWRLLESPAQVGVETHPSIMNAVRALSQ